MHSSGDPDYDSVDDNKSGNGVEEAQPQKSRLDDFRNRMVCIMIGHVCSLYSDVVKC